MLFGCVASTEFSEEDLQAMDRKLSVLIDFAKKSKVISVASEFDDGGNKEPSNKNSERLQRFHSTKRKRTTRDEKSPSVSRQLFSVIISLKD